MHEYEYARVDEYSPYYTWCTTLVALEYYIGYYTYYYSIMRSSMHSTSLASLLSIHIMHTLEYCMHTSGYSMHTNIL